MNNSDRNIIEEGKLNPIPEFYTSPVNNPVKEITGGNKKIAKDFIVLISHKDHSVTVPELDLGTGKVGRATITGSHGIKSGIPFLFGYVLQVATTNYGVPQSLTSFSEMPVFSSTVLFSNLYVSDSGYRIEAYNENNGLGPQTFSIRVFIYKLKTK